MGAGGAERHRYALVFCGRGTLRAAEHRPVIADTRPELACCCIHGCYLGNHVYGSGIWYRRGDSMRGNVVVSTSEDATSEATPIHER